MAVLHQWRTISIMGRDMTDEFPVYSNQRHKADFLREKDCSSRKKFGIVKCGADLVREYDVYQSKEAFKIGKET